MRVLVIILLVVGLSFVAITGYGLTRDPVPGDGSTSSSCASSPPMKDGELDEDAAEDWCRDPPGAIAGMTRRFGPRTRFLAGPVTAPRAGLDANEDAPPADPARRDEPEGKMRVVPFEWRADGPMQIRYKDQQLCLCRPGAALDAELMESCGEGWIRHRRQDGGALVCGEDDGQGTIILDADGGRVTFHALGERAVAGHPES